MLSSRVNFVVALAGSLVINLGGLWLIAHYYVPPRMYAHKQPPKSPPIQILPPEAPSPDEMIIGKDQGAGESVNETLADQVQTAQKHAEQDQANQTRESTGSHIADAGSRAMQPTFAPPPTELPMPPPSPAVAPRKYEKPKLPPSDHPSQQPQTPVKPQPPTQTPTPARQTGDPDAGKPAEPSDRDSDLFARETSVEFKDGKVVAQNGREIKFAHPRANLAAIVDTATIPFPAKLTVRVKVDERGSVRNVYIVRSTGSSSLDRVFELAVYESWFEPAKDKLGRPMTDESEFTMTID